MNLLFRKAKVLVVEDEKIIAKDIESTLKRIGHESAGSVAKGEEAISAAEKIHPDLILMDITLKGEMDGIEAARIINKKFSIPIVYITAHQDEDTIEKTKDTNPYGYITKPLDDRDLSTAINSAVYRRDVESKLKDAEDKYFRLSENAPDLIFRQELGSGKYTYVNNSSIKLTGYSPEDFYKNNSLLDSIVDPEYHEQYHYAHKMMLESSTAVPFEYMINHKYGKKIWLNQRSVVLRDKANNPVAVEAILTDITERKLYENKLEETTKKLRALSNYHQKIREDERLTISREIHDQLGQDLTVLKMDLAIIAKKEKKTSAIYEELKNISSNIDLIINKVRKIATELRPDILDKLGLTEAIEWHAGEFEQRSKIKCCTKLTEEDFTLNPEKSISIFRIFQETLTNAARHSGATEINVLLTFQNGWLILTIHDNGRGITQNEIEKNTSLGLLGMKERALLLGGILDIKGEKDKGTRVEIKIPLG